MNMKLNKIVTELLLFTMITGSCILNLDAKGKKTKIEVNQNQSIDMVSDAIGNIQKEINAEKHPFFISRTYEKCGDKIVSAVTKVNYKEYRKKPSYYKEVFDLSNDENYNSDSEKSTIEFIYRDGNDHITQINENDRRNTIKIAFNQKPENIETV